MVKVTTLSNDLIIGNVLKSSIIYSVSKGFFFFFWGGWGGGEEKVNDCTIKECHELSEL